MSGINNLNILTFIKDIYQSLKTIDYNFSNLKENINLRLCKLEDNQKTLLDRLENIETLLNKLNDNANENIKLDKNIEKQLLNKMSEMNEIQSLNSINTKLELKPKEFTIANLLENNYSFADINDSLKKIENSDNLLYLELDISNNNNNNNNNKNSIITGEHNTLQSLLF